MKKAMYKVSSVALVSITVILLAITVLPGHTHKEINHEGAPSKSSTLSFDGLGGGQQVDLCPDKAITSLVSGYPNGHDAIIYPSLGEPCDEIFDPSSVQSEWNVLVAAAQQDALFTCLDALGDQYLLADCESCNCPGHSGSFECAKGDPYDVEFDLQGVNIITEVHPQTQYYCRAYPEALAFCSQKIACSDTCPE